MQIEHILFVAVIAALFFGAKKIPEIMGGLGKGIREFKEAVNDVKKDISVK
jgi:sec-independent protein translocase protein TatA